MSDPSALDLQAARARLDRAHLALLRAWREARSDRDDPIGWARDARPELYAAFDDAQKATLAAAEARSIDDWPEPLTPLLEGGDDPPAVDLGHGRREAVAEWARTETSPDLVRRAVTRGGKKVARVLARTFAFPDAATLDAMLEAGAGSELAQNPALTDAERAHLSHWASDVLAGDASNPHVVQAVTVLRRLNEQGHPVPRPAVATLLWGVRALESEARELYRRERMFEALVVLAARLRTSTLRWLLRRRVKVRRQTYGPLIDELLARRPLAAADWRVLIDEATEERTGGAVDELAEVLADRPAALERHTFLRGWLAEHGPWPDRFMVAATAPLDEARDFVAREMTEDPKAALRAIDAHRDKLTDVLTARVFRPALAADDEAVREEAMRWIGQLRNEEAPAPKSPRSR